MAVPSVAQDDGLPFMEVGPWAKDKYSLVSLYDSLFSTGMKNKWDSRVYIDLCSGPGLVNIPNSNRFLWGSPIQALSVRDKFDKYIFCERLPRYLDALRKRVSRLFPEADVSFVLGDCNDQVEAIRGCIPKPSTKHTVLSFCFVDPFSLRVRFSTIRRIAERRFVDFLVLLALHMDANRNERIYTGKHPRLDDFLGQSEWRSRWANRTTNIAFPRFLAEEYSQQMAALKYLPMPFDLMKPIRSDVKNLPLYHLALFSRSPLALEYWKQVLKYSTAQGSLSFD